MHIGGRAALAAAQRRAGRAVRKPAFGVAIITPFILAGAVGASAPTPVRESAVTPLASVQSSGNRSGASVVAVTKTPTAFHVAASTRASMNSREYVFGGIGNGPIAAPANGRRGWGRCGGCVGGRGPCGSWC